MTRRDHKAPPERKTCRSGGVETPGVSERLRGCWNEDLSLEGEHEVKDKKKENRKTSNIREGLTI